MKEIVSRGRKVMMPQYIDELNPDQYKYYLFLSSALTSGVIDVDYFRTRWFSFLLGMDKTDYLILKPEYIQELAPHVESVVSGFLHKVEGELLPELSSCRNLLPQYKGHSGPGDWLNGMTFGQVVECSTVLESAAAADSDLEAWEHIARVMYGFSEGENVDSMLVQHCALLFSSVWKAITTAPVEINGKMIDFSIIFKGSSASRGLDDKTGWSGIIYEIASAGLFGTVKDVEAADFWAVLLYLYKCKFEYNHQDRSKK